jgi:prepilin-type N-terminal cleavage/methylation domain-containing protein
MQIKNTIEVRPSHFRLAARCVRSAFTLLELLLVLTILVVIGSMAIPAFDRMMERQRLRSAADEMRLAWDGAKITAMRTGQAQVFTCELGSNGYLIEPLVLHDDVNNIGEGATMLSGGVAVETSSSTYGMTTTAANTTDLAKKLDESLQFVSCVVAGDLRAFSLAQSGETASVNIENVNQSVIFYPDGTTSTAELRLQNERGDSVGVQIRGLTGHTKMLAFVGAGEATP